MVNSEGVHGYYIHITLYFKYEQNDWVPNNGEKLKTGELSDDNEIKSLFVKNLLQKYSNKKVIPKFINFTQEKTA